MHDQEVKNRHPSVTYLMEHSVAYMDNYYYCSTQIVLLGPREGRDELGRVMPVNEDVFTSAGQK